MTDHAMSDLEREAWACCYLLLEEMAEIAQTWELMSALCAEEPEHGITPEQKASLARAYGEAGARARSVIARMTPRAVSRDDLTVELDR